MIKKVQLPLLVTLPLFFMCLLLLNRPLYAYQQTNTENNNVVKKLAVKVEYFESDNITNEIPYFDNRFKIDAQIEELTLLFYRTMGSEPIILVRPDGSKLRVNKFPKEKIQWHDDSTFDMIKIKQPMPGPWQAIGSILPNSKIMVVSDVKLVVDPLPEIILTGETLKVTGQLFNGDKAISNPLFRNVITLDVDFYSTNNSAYENFGADAIKISSFRDDGFDLDEYAADNIFTGEFVLDFAPGEWQPIYYVKLPMATRELRQKPIILYASPVTLSIERAEEEGQQHQLKLSLNGQFVEVDSLIFQGKITFPDKQLKPFSIMDAQGKTRMLDIEYTEPGIYRVNMNAFGQTTSGREFRLVVQEFTFNVEALSDDLLQAFADGNPNEAENTGQSKKLTKKQSAQLLAEQLEAKRIEFELKEQEKQQQVLIAIVAANIIIILVALIIFLIMRRRKKK